MRLIFLYYAWQDQGSGQVIQGYTEAARALGHEVAVYGRPFPGIPLNYSLDIAAADAIVFLFEWTTVLHYGDPLDFARLLGQFPRERRIIIDGDGNYNEMVEVGGDYNHRDLAARNEWIEACDSLSDKIYQPTLHPLHSKVKPFLFYGYNPAWEVPLDFSNKEYGMVYVGHCKFRWLALCRVLKALEPIRDQVGRLGLVGEGWGSPPWWAEEMQMEDIYFSDPAYLKNLDVELMPAVPFGQVIDWMSKAVFNPVLVRPVFNKLRFVTPRLFETLAANTIPLFGIDEDHVREIYGDQAAELVLEEDSSEKILDVMRQPSRYTKLVNGIRSHLVKKHSHTARLQELIEIVQS